MQAEPRTYFLCHSSDDAVLTTRIARLIEEAGHATWVSSRDVAAGVSWPEAITRAIKACDVLLLVGTDAAMASPHVEREITLATQYRRQILPVMIDDSPLSPTLEYLLGASHRISTSRTRVLDDLRPTFGRRRPKAEYQHWNRESVDMGAHGTITLRRWGDGFSHPVLLIHGLGCDADDWGTTQQVAAMAGRPLTFIAPDLPHHTPWSTGRQFRLPDVAPMLGELMATLGFDEYSVVGHSLGGLIAVHLTSIDQRATRCVAGGITADSWLHRDDLVTTLSTSQPARTARRRRAPGVPRFPQPQPLGTGPPLQRSPSPTGRPEAAPRAGGVDHHLGRLRRHE